MKSRCRFGNRWRFSKTPDKLEALRKSFGSRYISPRAQA